MRCACGHPDCSGRDTADVPVVVNVVINQSTLACSDDYPAHVPGFGVLAAESARAAVAGTPTRNLTDSRSPGYTGGTTTGANLKALCRKHHLLKTFGQWTELQEPDGTVIWTSPTGHRYATTPASWFLFPALARHHTRQQARDRRRQTERNLNREQRLQREAALAAKDPPPF